jgi:MYXO-CTERM domain-containing protein
MHCRVYCFVALVLGLGLLLGACGDQAGGETGVLKRRIIYGDPDTSQAHMAVVVLQSSFGVCSGTLIHDRVVLTAAHCVDGVSTSRIDVGFGTNYNWGGDVDWVGVSEKWVHPDYVGTTQNNAYDIALVRLSQLPPVSVTPIPHLPGSLRLVDPDDEGMPIEFVGFGETETGGFGVKMTVTGTLNWICDSSSGCWISMQNGWFAYAYTICTDQEPGGPCGGDSGGPAFVWRNGTEYTAGITSYGVNQSCTGFGCSTKVDEFEAEILDFIGGVNGSTCFSGSECDSGICSDGVCCNTSCTGECRYCNLPESLGTCTTAPDGYPCPDSDKCDGIKTCQSGVCVDGPPPDCDDSNVCTTDSCNPSTGCVHTPVANGTSCSDGNRCNGVETCQNGVCRSPGEMDCDDGDPCTQDSCHPQNGCSNTPLQDGTSCDDNNECNGVEVCQGGDCVPGAALNCDDNNSCTADRCIPGTGCVHEPYSPGTPCNDDDLCTVEEVCLGGVCVGEEADCDDHNRCTTDSCDPVAGCVHTTLPDGTACGGGVCGQAVCSQGVCEPVGTGVSCQDYDPCTRDWCDPEQGCMYDPLPDGYECGQCDMCLDGECVHLDDCGDGGGCGCGGAPGDLPGVFGLLALAFVLFRRKSALI